MEQIPESPGAATPAPPDKPGFGSGFSAIFRIFYSPGSVFEDIRDGLSLWPGLIGFIVVLLAVTWGMAPLYTDIAQQQMAAQGNPGMGAGGLTAIIMVSQAIQGLLVLLVISFFYWLALVVSFGGVRYGRVLALTIYTSFIGILYQVLNLLYVRFSGVEIESAQDLRGGMLNLSLGVLFPDGEGFLVNLLNMLGLFQIWGLILMIMGTAVIAGRKRSQAAWPILVIFLLTVIVMAFLIGLAPQGMGG